MKRVPWINQEEWLSVKLKLMSNVVEDEMEAYETLLLWKARSINLPANIECTLAIIQALIQYLAKSKSPLFGSTILEGEAELQTTFALALVRFINHVSDASSPHRNSIYNIAQRKNIPDWIVNLRHDIAHSASLPPLEILESGILIAKQWLIENYWNNPAMDASAIGAGPEREKSQNSSVKSSHCKILISTAVKAWVACNFGSRAHNSHGAEVDLLTELRRVLNKEKRKNVKSLVEAINSEVQRLHKGKRSALRLTLLSSRILQLIKKRLLKHHTCLMNSSTILESIKKADFLKCTGDEIFEWEPILQILHQEDGLKGLIEYIFDQLQSGGEVRNAMMWLESLIDPLEYQYNRVHSQSGNATSYNVRDNSVWLDLYSPQILELKMETLRPLLTDGSPELDRRLLLRYMRFVRGALNSKQWSLMNDLLELYDGHEALGSNDILENEPYSVEALAAMEEHVRCKDSGVWRMTSNFDSEAWFKCPMGCLPWQTSAPMLQLPRTWVWEHASSVPNVF